MKGYIVLARCNFDDVVVGLYSSDAKGLNAALRRATAVVKRPSLRYQYDQANDTAFICCTIFLACGAKMKEVHKVEKGDGGAVLITAPKKATTA